MRFLHEIRDGEEVATSVILQHPPNQDFESDNEGSVPEEVSNFEPFDNGPDPYSKSDDENSPESDENDGWGAHSAAWYQQ